MLLNSYMVESRCLEKQRMAGFAAGNMAHRSRIGLEIMKIGNFAAAAVALAVDVVAVVVRSITQSNCSNYEIY